MRETFKKKSSPDFYDTIFPSSLDGFLEEIDTSEEEMAMLEDAADSLPTGRIDDELPIPERALLFQYGGFKS